MTEAQITQEPCGLRLRCACGTEQCYDKVSDAMHLGSTCGAQYTVAKLPDGLTVTPVARR
jgi:hypothetical protein